MMDALIQQVRRQFRENYLKLINLKAIVLEKTVNYKQFYSFFSNILNRKTKKW